jgi:hypothetical protein
VWLKLGLYYICFGVSRTSNKSSVTCPSRLNLAVQLLKSFYLRTAVRKCCCFTIPVEHKIVVELENRTKILFGHILHSTNTTDKNSVFTDQWIESALQQHKCCGLGDEKYFLIESLGTSLAYGRASSVLDMCCYIVLLLQKTPLKRRFKTTLIKRRWVSWVHAASYSDWAIE